MKVVFVDQINLVSLLYLYQWRYTLQAIWYFDTPTFFWKNILKLLSFLGILRVDIHGIQHYLSQVRDEDNKANRLKYLNEVASLCKKISQSQELKNPLLYTISSIWETDKIFLHFNKEIEKEISIEYKRLRLVKWITRTQLSFPFEEVLILVTYKYWLPHLQRELSSKNIKFSTYKKPLLANIQLFVSTLMVFSILFLPIMWVIKKCIQSMEKLKPTARNNSQVAIYYGRLKLSLDPTERSALFWLQDSNIPFNKVLLYGFRPHDDINFDEIETLKNMGMNIAQPMLPTWHLTLTRVKIIIPILYDIAKSWFVSLARGKWISFYYPYQLLILMLVYARWYEFYLTHNINLNISLPVHTQQVGQTLASDAHNIISVGYQQSVSAFYPSTVHTAGENVQIVFSPFFKSLWNETPVRNFVYTGYIHDSVAKFAHKKTAIRQQLQINGAEFLICFFDENSSNHWKSFISNDDTTDDYEYLLNWLLDDPTLGLVFKPKLPSTLFKRIGRIASLIEQAKQTGRCVFIADVDKHVAAKHSFNYPVEAALIADLCIGDLASSTAALEARLAGTPTILIDTFGLPSHLFYKEEGYNQFIFGSWDAVHTSVELYRANPTTHPEFGNWSPILDKLDPFQDGQASLRMGQYIRWLFEALKYGNTKEVALMIANEKYAAEWGSEYVSSNPK